jgi:hypothetical protein
MASIKLGALLLKAKVLTEQQLTAALTEQQKWGGKLGEILVRMNVLTEEMLVKALSKQLNVPAVNLESIQGIPPHVRAKVPPEMARDLVALPLQLRDDGRTLVVAMWEPQNLTQIDTLRSVSRCRIMPQMAGRTQIAKAFSRFYEGEGDPSDVEGSFKIMNAQGQTMIKSADAIAKPNGQGRFDGPAQAPAPPPPAVVAGPKELPPPAPAISLAEAPVRLTDQLTSQLPAGTNPSESLAKLEDNQRKEVSALKAMVELLIEKGVFTRDEYLAKVRK